MNVNSTRRLPTTHLTQYATLARQYGVVMGVNLDSEPERILHIIQANPVEKRTDVDQMANILAAGLSAGGTQHYLTTFTVEGSVLHNRGLCDAGASANRKHHIAIIWK